MTTTGTDVYGVWDKDALAGKAKFWFPNTDAILASHVVGDMESEVIYIFMYMIKKMCMEFGIRMC